MKPSCRIHLACVFLLLLRAAALPWAYDGSHQSSRQRVSINSGWKFKRWEANPDGIIYDQRPGLENLTVVSILKHGSYHRAMTSLKTLRTNTIFLASLQASTLYTHELVLTIVRGNLLTRRTIGQFQVLSIRSQTTFPLLEVGWAACPSSELDGIDADWISCLKTSTSKFTWKFNAMVWLNGELVGGWPYPYNSFRLDLTPHLQFPGENQLAIRLDNPVKSAR